MAGRSGRRHVSLHYREDGSLAPLKKDPVVVRGTGNITIFGISNRYNEEVPGALSSRLAPEEYKDTIRKLNTILRKRMSMELGLLCLGCLFCCCTCGCSCCPVVYVSKKTKARIQEFLEHENNHFYHSLGLSWKFVRQQCQGSLLVEYVIIIEFIPKTYINRPE